MTAERNPIARQRDERRFWGRVLIGSLTVAVVLALIAAFLIWQENRDQDDQIDVLAGQYEQVQKDKTDLCDEPANKTKPECATVAPPVEDVVPDVEDPDPPLVITQRLPTTVIREVQTLPASAVRNAVERACGGSCKGKDVTADMVRAAVTENCGGSCRGADGATYPPPQDGKDAPPPSDAQVLAAVASYCSENECKGDPGPTCPEGYVGSVLQVMTSLTETTEIFACQRVGEQP